MTQRDVAALPPALRSGRRERALARGADERIETLPWPIENSRTAAYGALVSEALAARRQLLDAALLELDQQAESLAATATRFVEALSGGRKVLVAGNGGSAAEAQHFAAELVGRFKRERAPYAVLALSTDTSILTAVANDYGYRQVFARQVLALGQPGDVLLAFSTSGESENLVQAAIAARQRGMGVVAVTGTQRSHLERLADLTVCVRVADTAVAQELQMVITHILCEIVESELTHLEGNGSR